MILKNYVFKKKDWRERNSSPSFEQKFFTSFFGQFAFGIADAKQKFLTSKLWSLTLFYLGGQFCHTLWFFGKNSLKIFWLVWNFLTIPKYVRGRFANFGLHKWFVKFLTYPWGLFFDFWPIHPNSKIKIAKT